MRGTLMTDFDAFWKIYPISPAKKAARKAWDKLQPDKTLVQQIMTALEAQIADREASVHRGDWRPDWPYPATWIRGERWTDALPQKTPVTPAQRDAARHWRFQAWAGLCKHDPVCAWDDDCLALIARTRRDVMVREQGR